MAAVSHPLPYPAPLKFCDDKLGFYMKEMTILNNRLSITLSTKLKGIDQDSDLYMGYKDHTRLFKVQMWYEKKRVIDQLTRMLHLLTPYLETQTEVSIRVVSSDDSPIGILTTGLPTIRSLQLNNTNPDTVDSIRHVYKTDTLGDSVTYVEKKGNPRFVGIGPAMPKPGTTNKSKGNPKINLLTGAQLLLAKKGSVKPSIYDDNTPNYVVGFI